MRPTVKKADFINWMYRGSDARDFQLDLAKYVIDELLKNGTVTISVTDEFKNAGYIPAEICTWNSNEEKKKYSGKEFEPADCDLID